MSTRPDLTDVWRGRLAELPGGVRVMLSAFLAIIGSGYLVSVANIFYRHQLADGLPGISLQDVRAVYGGIDVGGGPGQERSSRMLTMIRGEMRQYFSSDSNFQVLESWLMAGGTDPTLDQGERRKTPRRVLMRDCLRCHAQGTGTEISERTPFGPDELTVDYAMLAPVLPSAISAGEHAREPPQYTPARLVLVSHMHMLAIPMFTLAVGLLFMMTRLPRGVRAVLTPLPMLALVLDFSGWWLARLADVFVHFIAVGGAIFGLIFGVQVLSVLIDLWSPGRRSRQD